MDMTIGGAGKNVISVSKDGSARLKLCMCQLCGCLGHCAGPDQLLQPGPVDQLLQPGPGHNVQPLVGQCGGDLGAGAGGYCGHGADHGWGGWQPDNAGCDIR